MARELGRGAQVVVELVRLAVVVLFTALGFALAESAAGLLEDTDPESASLVTSVLGALIGYLVGGGVGRGLARGVDQAQQRLQRVDAAVLISSVLGAALASTFAFALLWPVLLLPAKSVTVPAAMILLVVIAYGGARVGASRGGDLGRFVGVRGRLEVSTPSRGAGTKLLDSSALIDGRLIELARTGFLDGTVIVPHFVLDEMQQLADAEEPRRRDAGRRGLDALQTLQDEQLVVVELTREDPAGIADVDAKLAALARRRGAALVTVDSGLARIAEISGLRVLNLHALADALRPPVLPGDRVELDIVREGREAGQGVGYLEDGTMVVVERAAGQVGSNIAVDVTSIMQNRQGRMLFASLAAERPAGERPGDERPRDRR